MKRQSLLPSIPTPKLYGPHRNGEVKCVGCEKSLHPGLCYTGTVLDGTAHSTIRGKENLPIMGVMVTHERTYILGGQQIDTSKKVSYFKRKRGYICDTCAANYHGVTDSNGTFHPTVKTDPRPGFIGEIKIPTVEIIESESAVRLPPLSSGNPAQRITKLDREGQGDLSPSLQNSPDNQWLNVGRR